MSTDAALKNTPLEQEHIALGAKMVDFAGWNMPVQYEGILQEFEYNRKTVSIFSCRRTDCLQVLPQRHSLSRTQADQFPD